MDAADDAGAQPHQPQLVRIDSDRGEDQSTTPAECGNDPRLARAGAFQPSAPDGGAGTEKYEEQRIHPAQDRFVPIAGSGEQHRDPARVRRTVDGFADAERFGQGNPENGKTIGHADAEVNTQRRGRHQPAIERRPGDGAFLVQKSGHCGSSSLFFSPGLDAPALSGACVAGE